MSEMPSDAFISKLIEPVSTIADLRPTLAWPEELRGLIGYARRVRALFDFRATPVYEGTPRPMSFDTLPDRDSTAMTKRDLNQYQSIASTDFLSHEELRCVLALVLDHLQLDILKEQTPDSTAFELIPRTDRRLTRSRG